MFFFSPRRTEGQRRMVSCTLWPRVRLSRAIRLSNLFVLQYLVNCQSVTYISKIVYNYREVNGSNSRGFKSNTLEINNRIFERLQNYINTYKSVNLNEYNKAFYINVIRRLDASLSVYFFAKGYGHFYYLRMKELRQILKSEPYNSAIRNVDIRKLMPKHRVTCLTAKTKMAFFVWIGYVGRQVAYRFLKLIR